MITAHARKRIQERVQCDSEHAIKFISSAIKMNLYTFKYDFAETSYFFIKMNGDIYLAIYSQKDKCIVTVLNEAKFRLSIKCHYAVKNFDDYLLKKRNKISGLSCCGNCLKAFNDDCGLFDVNKPFLLCENWVNDNKQYDDRNLIKIK